MIKLRSKRFSRSNNSKIAAAATEKSNSNSRINGDEIKWELRPGGMLVQKRDEIENINGSGDQAIITIRVSTVSKCHHISIQPTSTFGELKMMLSMITGLEPKEQRLLYRGKERENNEHLHMVGVKDKDKVMLFQDPSIKDTKLNLPRRLLISQLVSN